MCQNHWGSRQFLMYTQPQKVFAQKSTTAHPPFERYAISRQPLAISTCGRNNLSSIWHGTSGLKQTADERSGYVKASDFHYAKFPILSTSHRQPSETSSSVVRVSTDLDQDGPRSYLLGTCDKLFDIFALARKIVVLAYVV